MDDRPLFCTRCGTRLEERVVGHGGKTVPSCPACGAIHWLDPKVAAGCLVVRDGKVLLCRRGIQPGYGQWIFPGGHVDRGETVEAAALRETREECGVEAEIEALHGIYSYSGRPVIVVVFRARMAEGSPEPRPADETLEVGWFGPDEVAALELPFRSSAESLGTLFGRTYSVAPARR